MSSQHYRLTLEEAIARYKSRELTAKGLLRLYFEIKLKPGWEMKKTPREIYEELSISRASFYANYAILREEGKVIGEDPDEKPLSIRRPICNSGQHSRVLDSESRTLDSESRTLDSESRTLDSKSLNLPQGSVSSESPNSFPNSYQLFINSLSEEEREDFYEFGRKKANQLPHPPELPDKWIAANWEELKRQWKPPAKPCRDFSQHPQCGEWLDKIRTLGAGAFVFENGSRDQERSDFLDWADTSKLIWGQES